MNGERPMFPFSAIVGQDRMKLALLLNAIDPLIGGVLITGTRGTAKSTAVRALADVLPKPTPFVDLPVGATEDRVVGTIDIEKALKQGERHFEPGLLSKAHGGILYIDEVNLLPDHLVDIILDAAAMGVNRVERDGISFAHEARVILVGTMNPEEGELRPQLLDRFGLCVTAQSLSDAAVRKEAMRRRLAFDSNPVGIGSMFAEQQQALAEKLVASRRLLADVEVSDDVLDRIVEKCAEAGTDGLRADLALHRAAMAFAAWHGRTAVLETDLDAVEEFALSHRRRKRDRTPPPPPPPASRPPSSSSPVPNSGATPQSSKETVLGFGGALKTPWHDVLGRQARTGQRRMSSGKGRGLDAALFGIARVGARPTRSIAFAETFRTAGIRYRGCLPLTPLNLRDCMWRSRYQKRRRLVVFVVDASGSMAAAARMRAAKSAALGLLEKAYRLRSFVALIAFRNQTAETLLPPTRSAYHAFQRLRELPVGGATPMAEGLRSAGRLIYRALEKDSGLDPFLVVITDGRATFPADGFAEAQHIAAELCEKRILSLCIDTETGPVRLNQTAALARSLGGDCVHTNDLPSTSWAPIIEEWLSWK